jgi:Single-strand binding protein family
MNVVMLTGEVVSAPKVSAATDGTPKTSFTIEVDGGTLPLRFAILCFGGTANTAAQLVEGDCIALSGKMTAHAFTRSMNVVANQIEILTETEQENPNEHETAAASN